MSVGLFIGIFPSYVEEAEASAQKLINAINLRLQEFNLFAYSEPSKIPDVYIDYKFGRSDLDHHNAQCFAELAFLAEESNLDLPHLFLVSNPYRVVFLPQDFQKPFKIDYKEEIFGELEAVWTGSAQRLRQELAQLAPHLGIPIVNNNVSDEVAEKINEFLPLYEEEDRQLAKDKRTAWLALYEGARLAVENKIALSLAG